MIKFRISSLANLLFFLLFFLPLQTRWIISRAALGSGTSEYGTISIYAVEALLWLTFAFFILSGHIKLPKAGGGRRTGLALIAFLAYSFFGIFVNPDPLRGFFSWIHLLDGMMLFVLIAWGGIKNRWLIYSFLAGISIHAFLGIIQFSIQGISPSTLLGIAEHDPGTLGDAVVETTSGRWLRAYGGLPHPNILGGYLASAVIFLSTIILWKKINFKKEIIVLFVLMIFVSALFFTFSRGAMIALGIGGMVLLWNVFSQNNDERFHRALRFGVPVAALWIVLGLTFMPLIQTRFTGLGRLEQKSTDDRTEEYAVAMGLLPNYALSGTGMGAYTRRLEELKPGFPGYAYQPVHNTYLLLILELGIGAALLAFIFIVSFLLALDSRERWAAWPPLATLISLGFFDHYLWSLLPGQLLFWAVLGLIYNFKAEDA